MFNAIKNFFQENISYTIKRNKQKLPEEEYLGNV